MAIAFCSIGIGSLLVSLVLRRITTHPRIAPALLGMSGLLSFVSAFVHADGSGPTTTHGRIHQFVGVATFILIVAAMFSLVRAFRRDPSWRPIATPTLAWALTALASFFLVPISGNAYFGVAQRTMLAVFISWQLTISVYGHRVRHRRQTSPEHGKATRLATATRTASAAATRGRASGGAPAR
jgi:ABC-type Fe3+-siderophore transport system permease subunit